MFTKQAIHFEGDDMSQTNTDNRCHNLFFRVNTWPAWPVRMSARYLRECLSREQRSLRAVSPTTDFYLLCTVLVTVLWFESTM